MLEPSVDRESTKKRNRRLKYIKNEGSNVQKLYVSDMEGKLSHTKICSDVSQSRTHTTTELS